MTLNELNNILLNGHNLSDFISLLREHRGSVVLLGNVLQGEQEELDERLIIRNNEFYINTWEFDYQPEGIATVSLSGVFDLELADFFGLYPEYEKKYVPNEDCYFLYFRNSGEQPGDYCMTVAGKELDAGEDVEITYLRLKFSGKGEV
ncbi:hypothetical protein MKQ68_13880 [Chitinophaga horti]|uniref:Uncharacterized protein n=1 Tax=Chitinophaga horti TaxID=2920382 RepID=A0ABY6IV63_9BACT|nr:hypothetical protein [Chitinophaga horti]UYQ91180.1 hypothetical protein MKQ68_13880 [Chitinophaga horti]